MIMITMITVRMSKKVTRFVVTLLNLTFHVLSLRRAACWLECPANLVVSRDRLV